MQLYGNFSYMTLSANPDLSSAIATSAQRELQRTLVQQYPNTFSYNGQHPTCNKFVQVSKAGTLLFGCLCC